MLAPLRATGSFGAPCVLAPLRATGSFGAPCVLAPLRATGSFGAPCVLAPLRATGDSVTEQVLVGRIVKPHGIRGEVVVVVLSDVPDRFAPGTVHTVRDRSLVVTTSRPHQGRLLVAFEGIGDRTAAEALRGAELYAPPADVSESETYYAHELAGMQVVHADGTDLGTVVDLIDLPPAAGYDLLEVERADGTRWLLPAVDEYVEVAVDEAGSERLVLVDPPEGLVEPDRAEPTGEESG